MRGMLQVKQTVRLFLLERAFYLFKKYSAKAVLTQQTDKNTYFHYAHPWVSYVATVPIFLQVFPLVTYFFVCEKDVPSGYLAKLSVYNYEVGLFSSTHLNKKYTHGFESPWLSLFHTLLFFFF